MLRDTIWLPKVIIDSHCHGRDLDQEYKTTIVQVIKEGAQGLISTSVFQPNTNPPIIDIETLRLCLLKISSAKKETDSFFRQYVYFGATDDNFFQCEKALRSKSVLGIKVYPKSKDGFVVTTGTIGVAHDESLIKHMGIAYLANKVAAFHCDDPEIIDREGHTIAAEVSYVRKILKLAEQFPRLTIIICHVSCIESAKLILEAQWRGRRVVIELTPHHLWFSSDGMNWNPDLDPVFYHCYNQLRPRIHPVWLGERILASDNKLVIIGSDNAPHTRKEKLEKGYGGIPSNQEMVPVILTLAKRLGLSESRVTDLLCLNASRVLRIPLPKKFRYRKYLLEEWIDDLEYNNGIVENPFRGSKLLFPVPTEK